MISKLRKPISTKNENLRLALLALGIMLGFGSYIL